MITQPDFQQRMQSIERILGEVDSTADPNLRANVHELVQLVMDLHGAGIERMLELIRASTSGDTCISKLGRDELVSSLLILYGIHPVDFDTRLAMAVDKVRQKLRPHDGELALINTQNGSVRLRLEANGRGCGSTWQALKEVVEKAVYQDAPDVAELIIEGGEDKQGFVPIEMLRFATVPKGAA